MSSLPSSLGVRTPALGLEVNPHPQAHPSSCPSGPGHSSGLDTAALCPRPRACSHRTPEPRPSLSSFPTGPPFLTVARRPFPPSRPTCLWPEPLPPSWTLCAGQVSTPRLAELSPSQPRLHGCVPSLSPLLTQVGSGLRGSSSETPQTACLAKAAPHPL